MTTEVLDEQQRRTMTLEAFADTVIPGEKRFPGDRAVAGMSTGGGAVAAGALEVLSSPQGGMEGSLDDFAKGLNAHAAEYTAELGLAEDDSVPPFVALSGQERIALVRILTAAGHPEKAMWVGLALFCVMAFDTGPHLSTADAVRDGHVGLTALGFSQPDPDGLWRFPDSSYQRPLSSLHPGTTSTGSPA